MRAEPESPDLVILLDLADGARCQFSLLYRTLMYKYTPLARVTRFKVKFTRGRYIIGTMYGLFPGGQAH